MGHMNLDESYRNAFATAVMQRDQILEEFEKLKNRRALIESAAKALEPVVFPDEYRGQNSIETSSMAVEITRPAIDTEIRRTTTPIEINAPIPMREKTLEQRPVQAVTQVYVRGEGEPDEEIQRRISIAIGRSAAD